MPGLGYILIATCMHQGDRARRVIEHEQRLGGYVVKVGYACIVCDPRRQPLQKAHDIVRRIAHETPRERHTGDRRFGSRRLCERTAQRA
jgi:hypothetical protein